MSLFKSSLERLMCIPGMQGMGQVVFFFLREFYVFQQVSQMKSLERELETIHLENEGLKKKQVKLDEQLMEVSF